MLVLFLITFMNRFHKQSIPIICLNRYFSLTHETLSSETTLAICPLRNFSRVFKIASLFTLNGTVTITLSSPSRYWTVAVSEEADRTIGMQYLHPRPHNSIVTRRLHRPLTLLVQTAHRHFEKDFFMSVLVNLKSITVNEEYNDTYQGFWQSYLCIHLILYL